MDRSRTELGRPQLDAVFQHNPEYGQQPGHGGELADRLRAAFTVLEAEADAGHLTSYGVATWEGFADGLFTVPQLDRLATEAAGGPDHHLRLVQLPVSLVMADHLGESLHRYEPIHQAAERGWDVHASAPVHGGELLTLATPEVAALVQERATVVAACLAATVRARVSQECSCPPRTRHTGRTRSR